MQYPINFLCWVDRCLYPDDFKKELKTVGETLDIELDDIAYLAMNMTNYLKKSGKGIVGIYQEFALHNQQAKTLLDAYLSRMLIGWTKRN